MNPELRILAVEDDAINQQVLLRMLNCITGQVDLASDGEEAITRAQTAEYDLIFMDCKMPRVDGLSAAKIIRKEGRNQKTPIIAITGQFFDKGDTAYLKAGMNDYLCKPIRLAEIHAVVDKWTKSPAETRI